jgi:predicted Rdx family selenoprotein
VGEAGDGNTGGDENIIMSGVNIWDRNKGSVVN